MHTLARLALTSILFLGGCGLTETGLDEEFDLSPGQTAVLADARLAITFQSVGEDSRCPVDVTCVWAGNARVAVEAAAEGGPQEQFDINTAVPPTEGTFQGYVVEVVRVLPEPRSDIPLDPLDYKATFRVHRQ